MNSTVAAIAAFIATLGTANVHDNPALHPTGATFELGRTVGRLDETVNALSLNHNGWRATAAGQGNRNDRTAEGTTYMYSLQREFRPIDRPWRPVVGIGPAYVDNSPFVGRVNYALSAGVEWRGTFGLTYTHYSNAGMTSPNTGLDSIRLSMTADF